MKFREQTLEGIIYDNALSPEGRELLTERGLTISGTLFRQIDLGSYGRADLITIEYSDDYDDVLITIYELKKEKVDTNALLQAYRYLAAIKRHVYSEILFKICLIGESVETRGDFVFIYNELPNVEVYTYDYSITGIIFNKIGKNWTQSNERLNQETTEKILNEIECVTKGHKTIEDHVKSEG